MHFIPDYSLPVMCFCTCTVFKTPISYPITVTALQVSDDTLIQIFSTILDWHLAFKLFPAAVKSVSGKLIDATLRVYSQVLLPKSWGSFDLGNRGVKHPLELSLAGTPPRYLVGRACLQ